MTITQEKTIVGDTFLWDHEGLTFLVTVTEVRKSYGRLDANITPMAGTGRRWVNAANLTK